MKSYKVADVLELEHEQLKSLSFTSWHLRTLHAIRKCRTKELGGHIDSCTCCNKLHISYNSCRNRHCPNCQGHKREEWIKAREQELLNAPYFHVVFTLPSELNSNCLRYPKQMYDALFKASWSTLCLFASNELEAKLGMIALLHTWGQNLSLHPHLHCIVPAGGVNKFGRWKYCKKQGNFLFPVKAMSKVFRARYVSLLRKSKVPITQQEIDVLFTKNWVVYAKQAFKTPTYVVKYLGRYSHKIAITNYRIKKLDKQKRLVYFTAKDYKRAGKKVTICLKTTDFTKRFQLHILPKGFTRIRHYGILSSSWKKEKLPQLQAKLLGRSLKQLIEKVKTKTNHKRCPSCKVGLLQTIYIFGSRGPPKKYAYLLGKIK